MYFVVMIALVALGQNPKLYAAIILGISLWLSQPLKHDEHDACDGEKRRARKPADAVRQDVDCDSETNDHHRQPEYRESHQQSRGENLLTWMTKQE